MPTPPVAHIRRCDPTTISLLRSTTAITSLADILTELLHNALDADAKQIDCWVDLQTWGIRVADDGKGIMLEDMKQVGERYSTSKATEKHTNGQLFGFRGEALASIAALSVLEVTSRHVSESRGSTKIIKGGETLTCGLSRRYSRETAGTVVTVKDAFYNVPVRRIDSIQKDPFLSSLSSAHDVCAPKSALTACKRALELVAAINPKTGFTLTVEDETSVHGRETKRLLTAPKGDSLVKRFGTLYGMSTIAKAREIHVSCRGMRIDGFISLIPAYTKAHQHIYVNNLHLDRCDLHNLVSDKFARSEFGQDEDELGKTAIKTFRSPKVDAFKPVYLLNIRLAPSDVDAAFEPRKRAVVTRDYSAISQFVVAVVDEVLAKTGLLPTITADNCSRTPSPAPLRSNSSQTPRMSLQRQPERSPSPSPISRAPLPRGRKRNNMFPDNSSRDDIPGNVVTHTGRPQWLSELLTSKTQQPYRSIPIANQLCLDLREVGEINPHEPAAGSDRVNITKENLRCAQVIAQVDRKFICCSIPNGSLDNATHVLAFIDQHAADERIRVHRYLADVCNSFGKTGLPQKDLAKPIELSLTTHHAQWLANSHVVRRALHQWGFNLDFSPGDKDCQVTLLGVPRIVHERLCANAGKESQRTIEAYVEYLLENDITGLAALLSSCEGEGGIAVETTAILRWCPRRLLDLINSKACRGAIMFNDPLTIDQCRTLVRRLCETDFPFICAHGRPSLAPLATCVPRADNVVDARSFIDWKTVDLGIGPITEVQSK